MTLAFIFWLLYFLQRSSINIKNKCYYLVVVPSCEKENTPEGPAQKGLHEAKEQNKSKTKIKNNTKVWYLFLLLLIHN